MGADNAVKGGGGVRPLGEPLAIVDDVLGKKSPALPPTDSFAEEDAPTTLVLPRRQAKELAASVKEASRSRLPYILFAAAACVLFLGLSIAALSWWSTSPTKGDFAVHSKPSGARILLDGAITGKVTPSVLRGVTLGSEHRLRIELDGFHPQNMKIKIPRKRGEHRVDLKLEKLAKSPVSPAGNQQPKLLPLTP
ncbi:MAG: PEGA domain-containing protein [Deltaproteobacteria bacterium]|nr:PEGA domain-containing protein [Deltaproteobacteria bacterium]